jgi:hypothetical protein
MNQSISRGCTGSPRYCRDQDNMGAGNTGAPSTTVVNTPPTSALGATPPGGAAGAGTQGGAGAGDQQQQQRQTQKGNGANVVIPQSAMKRIKHEERERGRKEAAESLALELGFESVDAMKAQFKRGNGNRNRTQEQDVEIEPDQDLDQDTDQPNRQAKPDDKPNDRNERRNASKYEKRMEQFQKQQELLNRRLAQEVRSRKDLQRALDAKDAEMSLREAAVSAGVKDVDYAVRLLTRQLEGKDEASLKEFDETKFFSGLKDSHPYLFGETTRPANTGTGAGNAPPPPKPGQQAQQQATNGAVDARKMSREEFSAHLQKRGLNPGM